MNDDRKAPRTRFGGTGVVRSGPIVLLIAGLAAVVVVEFAKRDAQRQLHRMSSGGVSLSLQGVRIDRQEGVILRFSGTGTGTIGSLSTMSAYSVAWSLMRWEIVELHVN